MIDKGTRDEFDILFTFGDRHVPYHCEKTDKMILEMLEDVDPDIIIDGGDMISTDCLSKFKKTHAQMLGAAFEFQIDYIWRQQIQQVSPNSRKYILKDNHFIRRLDDFIQKTENYWLAELQELSPKSLLKLDDVDWKLVDSYNWKEEILFLHGDGPGMGGSARCPVNKSRALVKDAAVSIVKFHSHSTGFEVIRQSGKTRLAVQIGTIMALDKVSYSKHPELFNGSQSMGLFYLHKETNEFHYSPVVIMDSDRSMLNGKIYSK